ncbi:MAG: hypothetical protein ACYDH9_12440 [Limisphaerales bacterium]
MKPRLLGLAILAILISNAGAAVPAAEQLLPDDTLAVVTVRDWDKTHAVYEGSPAGQLWRDPEMKAIEEKFLNKLRDDVLTPIEHELGLKFTDYTNLVHGQVTLAVTPNGWQGDPGQIPGWLLLIDAGDKSDALKTVLADLRKKWVDARRETRSTKIRDLEFTTIVISGEDIAQIGEKAFGGSKPKEAANPDAKDKKPAVKLELTIGQSGSLLIAGSVPKDIEKVLVLQTGGSVPKLAEQPNFVANQGMFRDALTLGWVNFQPIAQVLSKLAAQANPAGNQNNPMALQPNKVLAATGIDGLKSLAFSVSYSAEGNLVNFFLGVPAAGRKGIFKIISAEAKDSTPPAFVPVDVIKFNRWRLDGQKTWATLETMINEISPELSGLLQMTLGAAGKDKDPNFDLKKSLIGNLGDDFITYQRSPRGLTLAALSSPPSILLLGSPNTEQLVQSLKMGASLVSPTQPAKEREFKGRKIYSFPLPPTPTPDGSQPTERNLNFAAGGGYLAISTDDAMIEEYLRSSETNPKALGQTAGLNEAAQKVGGTQTGLFGYENQNQTMRVTIEALKLNSDALDKMFTLRLNAGSSDGAKGGKGLKDWVDLSLLPPYEKIAKYFYFLVYAAGTGPDGFNLKMFSPTPPQLKK